ncbi:MAG: hypothetical protein AB7U05_05780 [Mangrovibacterium sp.]
MEKLPVMQLVNREMKRKKLNPADISKSLGLSYTAAHRMFLRPTIQVQRLAELSELLGYNFFRELAEKLPYDEPEVGDHPETNALKERIKELEIENRTLKEMVGKMMGH